MSVTREDLIKAAKELNDVLGLDLQIKTGKYPKKTSQFQFF